MIYCYDKNGDVIPEHLVFATIRTAARRQRYKFPRDGFDVEDLMQQALMSLLPKFPFYNLLILYVAAHRRISTYHRDIAIQKGVERGGRRKVLNTQENYSKEHPPDYRIEIKDYTDWVMSKLNAEDKELMIAYADKGTGSVTRLAEVRGVALDKLSRRYNRVLETTRGLVAEA